MTVIIQAKKKLKHLTIELDVCTADTCLVRGRADSKEKVAWKDNIREIL
jgi:hypothetical protein